MYTEEEKQFMALRAQFMAKLVDLDEQIEQLTAFRTRLQAVLDGEVPEPEDGPEGTSALEAQLDQLEERLDVLAPETKSEENLNETVNRAVVSFLKRNPGSSRSDVADRLKINIDDVGRSLSRMRRRGLVISEGRARSAKWYPTEA